MFRNFLFSSADDIGINFKTSEFPLLTRGEVITFISTSLFMCTCTSRSVFRKLAETCSGEKEQWYPWERRGYFAWRHHSTAFLLLPTWYTNFLFIHTNYIKLSFFYMFRAQSAHHREVNDANCTYAASGIVTVCKWPSCATAKAVLP